jgi:hypothetical protein
VHPTLRRVLAALPAGNGAREEKGMGYKGW